LRPLPGGGSPGRDPGAPAVLLRRLTTPGDPFRKPLGCDSLERRDALGRGRIARGPAALGCRSPTAYRRDSRFPRERHSSRSSTALSLWTNRSSATSVDRTAALRQLRIRGHRRPSRPLVVQSDSRRRSAAGTASASKRQRRCSKSSLPSGAGARRAYAPVCNLLDASLDESPGEAQSRRSVHTPPDRLRGCADARLADVLRPCPDRRGRVASGPLASHCGARGRRARNADPLFRHSLICLTLRV
jgi:hypothetical protein